MPTYSYKCSHCGTTFDHFQSMSAEPLQTCIECGNASVKRLIGAGAGLIFKGSGFYITDYKNGSDTSSTANGDKKGKTDKKSNKKSSDSKNKNIESKNIESKSDKKSDDV